MNKVEKWIEENKTKRDSSWNYRIDGYYIEDILPNTFETYAIIYHPYKLPIETQLTNEQEEQRELEKLIHKVNHQVTKDFKIPTDELPREKYIVEKREAKWEEVFKFYNLVFDKSSSWYDTFSLESKSKIYNSEMPDQDNIPFSILQKLYKFLKKHGVSSININSLANTSTPQTLIHEDSEAIFLDHIIKYENIHLIGSISNNWLFINPYDYCRTIVASSEDFINKLRVETTLEISDFVTSKHRFNKMYTNSQE